MDENKSTIARVSQDRSFLYQSSTISELSLLRIREKNRTRNRWHRSCDSALKTQLNRLQRSIELAVTDVGNSRNITDFIAEAETYPGNTWKVIKSLNKKKLHPLSRARSPMHWPGESKSSRWFTSPRFSELSSSPELDQQPCRISVLTTHFSAFQEDIPIVTYDKLAPPSSIRWKTRKAPVCTTSTTKLWKSFQ